jgi:Ni/Fe-hydrogenase subunit HybB-like protein
MKPTVAFLAAVLLSPLFLAAFIIGLCVVLVRCGVSAAERFTESMADWSNED